MRTLVTLALALSFVTPLEAAPLFVPSTPAPLVQQAQWDGDYYGGDNWERRGWRSERWQQRRHWRMRQARRDCYRYGDCQRWGMMQDRRGWDRRDYRRHRRGGLYLQFGF